ncbi:MAG: 6-carboxytetrahydropterin synthase QueD [Myxococcaceae bacterium]
MPQVDLSVDFHFCSAHALPFYDGPCKRMHGHNYRLQVTLAGPINPKDGMVRDFEEVRRKVWDAALAQCDHYTLNDFMPNPTAENLIVWIWERVQKQLPQLKELRLWETPEYAVAYRGE